MRQGETGESGVMRHMDDRGCRGGSNASGDAMAAFGGDAVTSRGKREEEFTENLEFQVRKVDFHRTFVN